MILHSEILLSFADGEFGSSANNLKKSSGRKVRTKRKPRILFTQVPFFIFCINRIDSFVTRENRIHRVFILPHSTVLFRG